MISECLSPLALRKVSRRCHGRANCSVIADTQTFGDPCFPGTRKHLRVSFTCGEQQMILLVTVVTWFTTLYNAELSALFSTPISSGRRGSRVNRPFHDFRLHTRWEWTRSCTDSIAGRRLCLVSESAPLTSRRMVHGPHLQTSKHALNQLSGSHWKNTGYVHWCLKPSG